MPQTALITELLQDWSNGDQSAGEKLMPLIYNELRRRSENVWRGERPGHTLQPTALINEAFLRLLDVDVTWQDRAHFFALSARLMRRLLIDHAKARASKKRGGEFVKVTFDGLPDQEPSNDLDLIDLTRALEKLKDGHSRQAQIVDLHYFGGLTVSEIQHVTGNSVATIGRDLRFARAWLFDEMSDGVAAPKK